MKMGGGSPGSICCGTMRDVRPRLIWLVVAPLAAVASQCAHWLAYRLTEPDGHAREQLLAATGHGYLDLLPLAGGIAGALVLAALGVQATAAARGAVKQASVARWPFALVPPLAFVLQEHVERLVHDGAVPLHAFTEKTFVAGLALQVPFGVAAWLAARLLLGAARAVGAAVGRTIRATRRARPAVPSRPGASPASRMRRRSPLALELAGRAPPLFANA